MNLPKISVIIPVYNTERFLPECLESVINQTYKNLEIITINDGSVDNSLEILKKYAMLDSRIKIIDKKNEGVSIARKIGLKIAAGEIVSFVDSDDWLDLDMYENLCIDMQINKADIVTSCYYTKGHYPVNRLHPKQGLYSYKLNNMTVLFENLFQFGNNGIIAGLCDKLFKKEIIEKVINVPEYIKYGEDVLITYPALLLAKSVYVNNNSFYHYRLNQSSASHKLMTDYYMQIDTLINLLIPIVENCKFSNILLPQAKKFLSQYVKYGLKSCLGLKDTVFYLFPYEKVIPNSNIAIYGAGEIGKSFYMQILQNNYCYVTLWVDKNADLLNNNCVKNISCLKDINVYDSVVIAIKNKYIVEEVIQEVINLGVKKENIIWKDYYIAY